MGAIEIMKEREGQRVGGQNNKEGEKQERERGREGENEKVLAFPVFSVKTLTRTRNPIKPT